VTRMISAWQTTDTEPAQSEFNETVIKRSLRPYTHRK
jgi:hypothetical protein